MALTLKTSEDIQSIFDKLPTELLSRISIFRPVHLFMPENTMETLNSLSSRLKQSEDKRAQELILSLDQIIESYEYSITQSSKHSSPIDLLLYRSSLDREISKVRRLLEDDSLAPQEDRAALKSAADQKLANYYEGKETDLWEVYMMYLKTKDIEGLRNTYTAMMRGASMSHLAPSPATNAATIALSVWVLESGLSLDSLSLESLLELPSSSDVGLLE